MTSLQSYTDHPIRYRPDIDGLRAFAVLAVVIFHAFPRLFPGGFIGVDIFFVISGYLITQIIIADLDVGRFSFARFYARRIRRIFPALILVLVVAETIGYTMLLPSELASLSRNIIAGALFGSNLGLWSEVGYFDLAAAFKPLLHLWSLGIEEQFYLAWPAALWLVARHWMRPLIVCLIVLSFGLNIVLIDGYPAAAFYSPFTRAWELIAGAALVGLSIESKALKEAFSLLVFLTAALTLALFNDRMTFPGWAALVPVAGTVLAILSEGSLLNRQILSHPFAIFIGRISYPLYLWHWPLLVFARIYVFRSLTRLEIFAVLTLAFLLSWLTNRLVETPIRNWKLRAVPTLLTGMLAAIALAVVGITFPRTHFPPEIDRLVSISAELPDWRLHRCMLVEGDQEFSPDCIDARRPLIALWGDSTAGALMPGLRELQSQYQFGIAQLTISGCPPLLLLTPFADTKCLDRNRKALRLLEAARPTTVVLHAISWDESVENLRPTVDALRSIGVSRIVLIGKVPIWHGGLPNLVAAYYRHTGELLSVRSEINVDSRSDEAELRSVSEQLKIEVFSARALLCDTRVGCLTRVGNALIVSDSLHFTPEGSKYLIERAGPLILGRGKTIVD